MLTTRISHPLPPQASQDSIDIFSSSLSALFTDDTQNSHGTPGSHVIYASPSFGDLTLRIPVHPDTEEGRQLFAHYLWNAGVLVAEGLEQGSQSRTESESELGARTVGTWDPRWWNVRGKKTLELGAGTALPSLISALSGASIVTITDHPSSPALSASSPNIIALNVKQNLFPADSPLRTSASVSIRGYVWGETVMWDADAFGKPVSESVDERYDKVIMADCLWMPSQHENLVKTVCHFLDDASEGSCAIVVAGFHTGRSTVRDFFNIATDDSEGGQHSNNEEHEKNTRSFGDFGGVGKGRLRAVEMFEIDIDGNRREWLADRPGESREQAKRWCVVAVLVKKQS